jgi:hypothetical protein
MLLDWHERVQLLQVEGLVLPGQKLPPEAQRCSRTAAKAPSRSTRISSHLPRDAKRVITAWAPPQRFRARFRYHAQGSAADDINAPQPRRAEEHLAGLLAQGRLLEPSTATILFQLPRNMKLTRAGLGGAPRVASRGSAMAFQVSPRLVARRAVYVCSREERGALHRRYRSPGDAAGRHRGF